MSTPEHPLETTKGEAPPFHRIILANRLVGILHGCLKTGTLYDETTAWSHHAENVAA